MVVRLSACAVAVSLVIASGATAWCGELGVTAISPASNALSAPVSATIEVTFDLPVDPATVTSASFWAFARWSGTVSGTFSYSNGDQTVTLTPDSPFSAGESVMVILSHDIAATDGTPLRDAGYSFLFWTAAQPANLEFEQIDQFTTRTFPSQSTRSYGGAGSDLDNDGFLDLTIINEDTADVRVFLNLADGSGLYGDFLEPTTPVGQQASPNEPSDFNHDGNVDLCVCNIAAQTVSVLLGNGDGSFAPGQLIVVGTNPRGIAVLDADGDGDIDIVNTNAGSGNLSVLTNDGNGVFGAPTFFEGGGAGEWGLAAADMNEDGILDLVIGTQGSDEILVNTGNGDGSFAFASAQPNVGNVWMIVLGDLDGDGHCDVATADSTSNDGSILFGDGAGNVSPPASYGVDPFPLATDLGDIDGDGDLDWVLSSFLGDWRLFVNDGNGSFSFQQEFPAPDAASCALMMDIDNDGDLDMALIDELEDVVILQRQGPSAPDFVRGDIDGDGFVNISDPILGLDHLFNGGSIDCQDALDIDDDGGLQLNDPILLLAYLFDSGLAPAAPWPSCGVDGTVGDPLECAGPYPACP